MWSVDVSIKPNILVIGYRKFSQLIHTVIPRFESQAQIKIVDHVFEHDIDIGAVIERNNADVVVTAGTNAAYLKDTLSIPVVGLEISEVDVIESILKASAISKKIVSITFGRNDQASTWNALIPLLGVEISVKHYSTLEEARESLYLAINEGFELVIGGSFVCELAERHGLKTVFLYSARSCQHVMETAVAAAKAWQQKKLSSGFEEALFELPEYPAIAVDDRGRIVRSSASAKKRLALTETSTPSFLKLLDNEYSSLQESTEKALNYEGSNWMVSCNRIYIHNHIAVHLFRFRPDSKSSKFLLGEDRPSESKTSNDFIYKSKAMREVQELIESYGKTQGTVLITGATGTGKELVARKLHRHSEFSGGDFVAINCGAIPDELFESELFGYVEGAFTTSRRGGRKGLLESANGGVFFLDEISEMPLGQQAKLLRVMQERVLRPLGSNKEVPLDLKFVAATNKNLLQCVKEKTFREDLFYRINVFSISLPSLASREKDVLAISEYFAEKTVHAYKMKLNVPKFINVLKERLLHYAWPGNVRELENIIERLVVAHDAFPSQALFVDALPSIVPEWYRIEETGAAGSDGSIRDQEHKLIQDALDKYGGNKEQAAKSLGISKTTLWRRIKENGA